ncbi:MAG: DUF4321 domain-containing protein [Gorillibacterium sp.]|nr:DUF4321 domain-containing protein [Gorillibacterium sp.]
MKKSNLALVLFIVLGLVTGLILTELLADVKGISFLTKSAQMTWHPKADFHVLKYDIDMTIRLNQLCIASMAAAFWIYRKV